MFTSRVIIVLCVINVMQKVVQDFKSAKLFCYWLKNTVVSITNCTISLRQIINFMLHLISINSSMLYCKKKIKKINICSFLMNISIMKIATPPTDNIFSSLCHNENCGKKYNVYSIAITCKMHSLLNLWNTFLNNWNV